MWEQATRTAIHYVVDSVGLSYVVAYRWTKMAVFRAEYLVFQHRHDRFACLQAAQVECDPQQLHTQDV